MPGLIAKMRHVDHRGRIVRHHAQAIPGAQSLHPLARFQNGQGAQQPQSIKFMFHASDLARTAPRENHFSPPARMFHPRHKDVTALHRDAAVELA